jgi:F0F1-type ATP synthase delta subunit
MANELVEAKARALLSLVTNAQGVIDEAKLLDVVRELLKTNQPAKREIVRRLAVLAENIQTRQLAEVTSAVALPKTTQDALASLVHRNHPEVKQITWQINPDLLGGFTVRVADTWYDMSISADLQLIKEQLSQ